MTNKELANLIFPKITKTIEDYNNIYPNRNLKEGACVTRFAPSPTGFIHIGGLMQAIIDYIVAKKTGGVFYLRNEDTDKSREVDSALDLIMDTLKHYEIVPDEYEYKGEIIGEYGPYVQSERKEIYHTFIKYLIEIGRAYPCFCTKEEKEETRKIQEKSKMRTGYYGKYATCRRLSLEECEKRIKNGEPYVIRFKSNGDFDKKFGFQDLAKGKLFLPQNDQDIVIMKSDNLLPTYHFAHVVDDYLMKTTHVVRGEEWISSLPIHLELFQAFGFEPPKYIHTPLIMKKEGNSVRKISKRKDPEALMSYYKEKGYPIYAVIESLMTIINSNYEQWHTKYPEKKFTEFEFNPKKMSSSGAFYDLEKLDNISKNYISTISAEEVYNNVLAWAKDYDHIFYDLLVKYDDYSKKIFNIERNQKKPRKDYVNYSTIKEQIWYMYDELFSDVSYDFGKINSKDEINTILETYIDKYYQDSDDKDTWFQKIKLLSEELGYASDMKEYKKNPESFKGSVADISTVIRVAVTTRQNTPDLYEILKLLGKQRIENRFKMVFNFK